MNELKLNLRKKMPDFKKMNEQEMKKLESKSKKLNELIVSENFIVEEVISESYATSFTPKSEMVLGGYSPSYSVGHTSRLVLKVSPDNKEIPVQTLNFSGSSIIKAGDYISAKIPKYKKSKYNGLFKKEKTFYFDRDFNSEESVIELALLSENEEVLRKDRSVDYRNFIKE